MSTRARLDREQVLDAAEAIVDRDGWREVTMTGLAGELGVKAPSLYNHVPNLGALRAELQKRAMREIGERLNRRAMGRTGENAMRALAETFRAYAREHPSRYDLAMSAPIDPEALEEATADAGAAVRAVIRSYGIDDDRFEYMVSVFAALHGVLVLENSQFFPDVIDLERVYEVVLGAILDVLDRAAPAEAKSA